jgi:hypothetical protein
VQIIEYTFGDLKRAFPVIAKNVIRLGATSKQMSKRAKRIQCVWNVCWCFQNARVELVRRLARPDTGKLSLLQCKYSAEDIAIPILQNPSQSCVNALKNIPQLTKNWIEQAFVGHFRNHRDGTNTTNLLAKGARLVLGHHVLGMRWKSLEMSVLLAFVVIASYRTGVYHVCIDIARNLEILGWYCTCYVGRGTCIHKAGVFQLRRLTAHRAFLYNAVMNSSFLLVMRCVTSSAGSICPYFTSSCPLHWSFTHVNWSRKRTMR